MTDVKAIVVRAAGINCDVETQYAFTYAGAQADRIHINQLIKEKHLLDQYHILVFPGGFSYGDDVAAGRILANQVIHHLSDQVWRFIEQGKLVLGICNGFQVLVKAGILPGISQTRSQEDITITMNDSGKYEDRWVYLKPHTDRCVFIDPDRQIYLPIAHAEGKVVTNRQEYITSLQAAGHVAFTYVDAHGREGGYPVNPNGSMGAIAGLTDTTGRVLGLMPHPERFIKPTHHPHWTRLRDQVHCDGMIIFNQAVSYVKNHLLADPVIK